MVSIGPSAFRCITKLNLKKLPDGLTFIGLQAFEECETLALTELPSGLTTIELRAFKRCGNLKLKSLPAGITKIDKEAFAGCVSLEFTSLPEALTEIGKMAFMNCAFRQLTLPAGVVRIEEDAFKGCESMKAVNILAEDPPVMDDIYLGEYADVIRVPAASLENTAQLPAGANGKPNSARSPLSRSRIPLPQDRIATGTRPEGSVRRTLRNSVSGHFPRFLLRHRQRRSQPLPHTCADLAVSLMKQPRQPSRA